MIPSDRPYLPSYEDVDAAACIACVTLSSFGYVHALDLTADKLVSVEALTHVVKISQGNLLRGGLAANRQGLILDPEFWAVRDHDNNE